MWQVRLHLERSKNEGPLSSCVFEKKPYHLRKLAVQNCVARCAAGCTELAWTHPSGCRPEDERREDGIRWWRLTITKFKSNTSQVRQQNVSWQKNPKNKSNNMLLASYQSQHDEYWEYTILVAKCNEAFSDWNFVICYLSDNVSV